MTHGSERDRTNVRGRRTPDYAEIATRLGISGGAAHPLGATMSDEPTPAPQIEGVVIPQNKAEQVATTIFGAIRGDITGLHAEMAAIRSTTTGIQGELALLANKADIQRLRTDVQARIERVERRLLMGFGVLAGLLAGLVIAALRYLPTIGHS